MKPPPHTAVPPEPRADAASAVPAPVTRLAPSPTGALHLGNARTFLVNWAIARKLGWRIILRIEDIDGPRVKPGAIELTIDLLRWLGMDWDSGPFIQSHDLGPCRDAMRTLAHAALVYPCELTRSQIEAAASAPQEGAHDVAFPASLRPALAPREFSTDDERTSWRFVTPPGAIEFDDLFAPRQRHDLAATIGDFVVWTRQEQPSYQLAVVVDDARQGVTHVVRGDDLLNSAARQIALQRALTLPTPTYCHLPLVKGPDGRRLAKRHGDTRLDTYRARAIPAQRVIGLVAHWCGLGPRVPISAAEFRDRLDLDTIPRGEVTFTPEDEQWLLSN